MRNGERIRISSRIVIYQRGKKRVYVADFHHNGQHQHRSLKTTNRKVAERRADAIDHALYGGTFNSQAAPTTKPLPRIALVDAIQQYIDYLKVEGRRHKTTRRYLGILTVFANFAKTNGIGLLTEISLSFFDQFRAHRTLTLKPKSMHNEATIIKAFLSWCAERDLIDRNPLEKRKFTPPKAKDRPAPSLEQVNKILKAASEVRFPVLVLLAFSGARSGEARHLRPEDVDLVGNWLHIRSRPGFETKNGQDRKVPLHPRLRKVLEGLSKEKRQWLFTALPSRRYPNGGHWISTKHLNEDFQKILKRLGMPVGRQDGFTIHSLRRFFRTTCVNAGIVERAVDLWCGHNDKSTMGGVYYDLNDEQSQKFMSKVPFDGKPAADAGNQSNGASK